METARLCCLAHLKLRAFHKSGPGCSRLKLAANHRNRSRKSPCDNRPRQLGHPIRRFCPTFPDSAYLICASHLEVGRGMRYLEGLRAPLVCVSSLDLGRPHCERPFFLVQAGQLTGGAPSCRWTEISTPWPAKRRSSKRLPTGMGFASRVVMLAPMSTSTDRAPGA